eukprot:TRINITY_DN31537_c0_g1_i1.p1 TRINITY_DN31537_c0_g1~~TRINITY_DN31537_c0_g1_i1.p1  ORF type:complete len:433 (-),score=68.60 TRINITY_DN31537_c0_g1_i1:3-1301(-)
MAQLSTDLCHLIQAHAGDVDALQGSNSQETEVIHAALCRFLQHVLEWTPVNFETSEARIGGLEAGFVCLKAEWWCRIGLTQDALFSELGGWYRSLRLKHDHPESDPVSNVLLAQVRRCAQELDSRQECYKDSPFNKVVKALATSIVQWDISKNLCDDIQKMAKPVAVVAFSFGTGQKIGKALDMPTLVGPGCETPGNTNCGLALAVRKIIEESPSSVFAQWEIADALLHGSEGAHNAASFASWDFGGADGSYQLQEPCTLRSLSPGSVAVYKAVPTWPKAVKDREVCLDELREHQKMWKYYLGTPDVVEQMTPHWCSSETAPRSFLLVGHQDHVGRCIRLLDVPHIAGDGQQILLAGPKLMPSPAEWASCGCDAFGYDPASTQPWTRNRAMFLTREMIARCGGVLLGVYRAEACVTGHKLLLDSRAIDLDRK